MKKIMALALLVAAGCTTSKFDKGTYKVESAHAVNGRSIVKFEGLKKEFVFETDTLKKGDLIYFVKKEK